MCAHVTLGRQASQTGPWQPPENPAWRIPLAKRPGYTLFAIAVAKLREHLPAAFPVVVRTSRVPAGIDGYCVRRARRFVVAISRKLSCGAAVNTLLHEWAHARAWSHLTDTADRESMSTEQYERLAHGPEFGLAYAETWRLLVTVIMPAYVLVETGRGAANRGLRRPCTPAGKPPGQCRCAALTRR